MKPRFEENARHLVALGAALPCQLGEVLLREVDELRSMLESCRKERAELQAKVWKGKR